MNDKTVHDLNTKAWDCIVIGAGPAGALSACQIAKENKNVLLIDKENFPRNKVCGCCINGIALEILKIAGLGNLLTDNDAHPLNTLRLFNNKQMANLSIPTGFCLSREKFDMALVNAAVDAGAKFLSGCSAKVLSLDSLPLVQIDSNTSTYSLQAKIVIIADGLSGTSLNLLSQFAPKIQNNSRFGASVILNKRPNYIEAGKIYMACGKGGYVGMVILEDDRLNIAAALNHNFSRQFNGPGAAAASLLRDNGLSLQRI